MQYKFENKTTLDRFIELFYSIKIIFDCMSLIEKGKSYHVIPIFGQLRALLAEKKAKNKALLFDLALILKYELKIFYSDYQIPKDNSLVVSLFFPKPNSTKLKDTDTEATLEEFLELQVIKLDKYFFTNKDFIDLFANKLGGSHYDDKLREDYHLLKYSNIFMQGEPIINKYAVLLGQSIFNIAFEFISRFINTSLYFTLYIPNQKIEGQSVIYEITYPNTKQKISCTLSNNNILSFNIFDLADNQFSIEIQTTEEIFDSLSVFNFNVLLTDELKTDISIYYEDKCLVQKEFDETVLIVNDLGNASRVYNNSYEFNSKGLEMGIFNFLVSYQFTSENHEIYLKNIHEEIKENKLMWLQPDQYVGYIAGEKEAIINHDLKFIETKGLIKNSG